MTVFKETTNSEQAPRSGAVFAPQGGPSSRPLTMVVGELSDTAFETYDTAPQADATVDGIIALYRLTLDPHNSGSSWEGLTQTRPALLSTQGLFGSGFLRRIQRRSKFATHTSHASSVYEHQLATQWRSKLLSMARTKTSGSRHAPAKVDRSPSQWLYSAHKKVPTIHHFMHVRTPPFLPEPRTVQTHTEHARTSTRTLLKANGGLRKATKSGVLKRGIEKKKRTTSHSAVALETQQLHALQHTFSRCSCEPNHTTQPALSKCEVRKSKIAIVRIDTCRNKQQTPEAAAGCPSSDTFSKPTESSRSTERATDKFTI